MESTFSDTESESEICHSPNWISNASQASISFNYGEFSYPNSETQHIPELEVITAIENLEDTCVSLSEELIQDSSLTICTFLEGSILESHDLNVSGFSKLLSPAFLDALFYHRKSYRHIAAIELSLSRNRTDTIVCWADKIIARIGSAILSFAGCTHDATSSQSENEGMKKHEENTRLIATAYLPDSWSDLPSVFNSPRFSPATRRLALSLIFGSFVMYPDIEPSSQGFDDGYIHKIFTSTQEYMGKLCSTRNMTLDDMCNDSQRGTPFERLEHAFVCALYSAADIASTFNRGDDDHMNPYRPFTHTSLLRLIHSALFNCYDHDDSASDSALLSVDEFDAPSNILLRWGRFTPWAWSVWSSSSQSDIIRPLTTAWITCFIRSKHEGDQGPTWPETFAEEACQYPDLAPHYIVQQLQRFIPEPDHTSEASQFHSSKLTLFSTLCLALTRLSELDGDAEGKNRSKDAVNPACGLLCHLMEVLGPTEEENQVKEMIVEFFASLDPEVIVFALSNGNEGGVSNVESIFRRLSSLTLQETEDANASEAIKLLTQFLTIILPAFMPSPSYSSASLRPNLVRWTSAINNRPTTLVLEQLVLLLAVFEECNSKSQNISLVPYKKEQVHEMVMAQSRSDLVLASAYGRFVAASPPTDPLTIVESWDRLRDTLLFILRGRYIEELEVPLAVLLSSNICWPLSKLLRNVDPSALTFILESPWTISLVAELNDLLLSEDDSLQMLRSRLDKSARALLALVKVLEEGKEVPSESGASYSYHLLYAKLGGYRRLVCFASDNDSM